jgi:O-antigen ligase
MRYKNNGEMDKYYPSYENIEPHHAHNMLLVVLSEMGLIGFMIFLYIFYIIYVKFIKPYNLTYLGSIGFIFAVSPLQTGKSISGSDWKFFVTLSLLFVFITYFIEKNKINSDVTT